MTDKLNVEWDSYEMPSYGFPEFEEKKKYGIVGGLGVVSDEVLPRISDKVNITGIGMRHLRGRDLPIYEEIEGYRVIRPIAEMTHMEAAEKCKILFEKAGVEFNGTHAGELRYLPFLRDYGLVIPQIRTYQDPDIICAHDWMAVLGAYEKSVNHKVPLVTFMHSLESGRQGGMIHTLEGPKENHFGGVYAGSRTIRDIEAIGIKKADVCFTVGTSMVEEVKKVSKLHGIPVKEIEKKTYPLHHGVDTKMFHPITGVRKDYDLIFIGRFSPVKGILEFIDAIKMLKRKYPGIRANLIGGGELEDVIYHKIKNYDLEKNIDVTTRWVPIDEKVVEINRAKIAVAPSKYEPHGQYDLEAGACGVPCINGTGGFMERMIDKVTALQCDPFSPADIAEKVEYLLKDQEKIDEIGVNARDFIVRYYDWDKRAKIYPPMFEAIANNDLDSLDDLPLIVEIDSAEYASAIKKMSEILGSH